jgi:hypothetical protein
LKTFPLLSRPAFWVFLGGMVVLMTLFIVVSLLKGDYPPAIGFGLFLLLLAVSLYPTRIEVDAKEVRLRSGLLVSRRLRIGEILRVREARSSGALSLRKELGLQIEGSKLTISACVKDIPGLRKTLLQVVPGLHEYGGELRRS